MKIAVIYKKTPNDIVDDISLFGLNNLLARHEAQFFELSYSLSNDMSNFDSIILSSPILEEKSKWWNILETESLKERVLLYGAYVKNNLSSDKISILKSLSSLKRISLQKPLLFDYLINEPIVGRSSFFAKSYEETRIENIFTPQKSDEKWLITKLKFLYELYSKKNKTLFLVTNPLDFLLTPTAGNTTLISPRFYELIIKAIASSRRVITGRIDVAMVALGNSVPVIFIDKEVDKLCEFLKIPTVIIRRDSDPIELINQIEKLFLEYDYSEIELQKNKLIKNVENFFTNHSIIVSSSKTKPFITQKKRLSIASISDLSYSGSLCGLIENIIEVHKGEVSFHILCLEEELKSFLLDKYRHIEIKTYLLDELWSKDELTRVLKRSMGFRAFSSKPRLIKKALLRENNFVLYTDSDVFYFDSPIKLNDYMCEKSILLFPHWNDNFPQARLDGLYNAGMIGVKPGAEKFLDWWAKLCLYSCTLNEENGVVGDQGYLDFSPLYFEDTTTYKNYDHNVARWNIKTLGLAIKNLFPPSPVIFNGDSVKSYHAAFMDSVGVFEKKYVWDQLFAFILDNSSSQTYKNTISLQRLYWKELNRIIYINSIIERLLGIKSLLPCDKKFWLAGFGQRLLKCFKFLKFKKDSKKDDKTNFWCNFQSEMLSNNKITTFKNYTPAWEYVHKKMDDNQILPELTRRAKCSNERS